MEWNIWSANRDSGPPAEESQQDHAALLREHLSELYRPFREEGPEGQCRVFWQNLVSNDAPTASAIGRITVTDEIRDMVAVLDLRGFAVANGHVVLSESQRELATSYSRYLEEQGLVSSNAIDNAIFVENATEYAAVMNIITGLIAERGTQIEVVPYLQAGKLFDLAADAGVRIHGSSKEVAHEVVDALYNKTNYRDLIEALAGPLPYPRLSMHQGQEVGIREEYLLRRCLEHVPKPEGDGPRQALFLQAVSSGGGFGNAIVYERSDGSLEYQAATGTKHSFTSPKEFLKYLSKLDVDTDITPFLQVTRSYSFGIVVADSGITVFGPRHQVLDDKNNFMGWRVNQSEPEESMAPIRAQMEVSRRLGVELWNAGYRGCLSEDLFEYLDPAGEVKIGRAEANVRRDATTLLTGLLLSLDKGSDALLSGDISIRQSDHFPIGKRHEYKSTAELVSYLKEEGFPLVSNQNPYGIVLISPPVKNKGTGHDFAVIGVTGPNDAERDRLYSRLEDVLR